MTEKKHESAAEKQRAYRERKAREKLEAAMPGYLEQKSYSPDQVKTHALEDDASTVPELDTELLSDLEEHELRHRLGYSSSETRSKAERDQAAARMVGRSPGEFMAEETYVQAQLAQTIVYMDSFRAPEKTTPEARAERLRRAERYARWRWQAYSEGEVFSL